MGDSNDPLCKNVLCGSTETCTGGVCVPMDMFNAKEGDPCLESWTAEYCDADGNAVYCAMDAQNNIKIAKESCGQGCKVGFSTESDFTFAGCVDENSAKCTSNQDEFGYCFEDSGYSIASSYYCYDAIGGGFIALDALYYDFAYLCDGTCNDLGTGCEGDCLTDADCGGDKPYCDTDYGICAECIADDANRKCKDSTKYCDVNDDDEYYCASKPDTPSCTENEKKCDGNYVSTCTGGKWVNASSACAKGCSNGACKTDGGSAVTYVETFADHDSDATGTSNGYTETSYTSPISGVKWTSDGFTWKLVSAGTDYAINKGGMMLGKSKKLEATLPNGATGISVKVGEGSSAAKSKVVTIYLNGTSCGTVDVKGKSGSSAETLTCSASASGSAAIKIVAPAYAVVLDDLTWTEN